MCSEGRNKQDANTKKSSHVNAIQQSKKRPESRTRPHLDSAHIPHFKVAIGAARKQIHCSEKKLQFILSLGLLQTLRGDHTFPAGAIVAAA
jgi:hypothetical protein